MPTANDTAMRIAVEAPIARLAERIPTRDVCVSLAKLDALPNRGEIAEHQIAALVGVLVQRHPSVAARHASLTPHGDGTNVVYGVIAAALAVS